MVRRRGVESTRRSRGAVGVEGRMYERIGGRWGIDESRDGSSLFWSAESSVVVEIMLSSGLMPWTREAK